MAPSPSWLPGAERRAPAGVGTDGSDLCLDREQAEPGRLSGRTPISLPTAIGSWNQMAFEQLVGDWRGHAVDERRPHARIIPHQLHDPLFPRRWRLPPLAGEFRA